MTESDTWSHAQRREFDHVGVRQLLDQAPMDRIVEWFGQPVVHTTYQQPIGRHWAQGDGRPALADEDPAVMQAIGRCAASRVRSPVPSLSPGRIHPAPCGWCGYPLDALLAACDWATWRSLCIVAETLTWYEDPSKRSGAGGEYHREGRPGGYTAPAWVDLWALPRDERAARVAAAMYPAGGPA